MSSYRGVHNEWDGPSRDVREADSIDEAVCIVEPPTVGSDDEAGANMTGHLSREEWIRMEGFPALNLEAVR